MRPAPTTTKLETLPHLRAWKSMPLPTTDISAYFDDWKENVRRPSNGTYEFTTLVKIIVRVICKVPGMENDFMTYATSLDLDQTVHVRSQIIVYTGH